MINALIVWSDASATSGQFDTWNEAKAQVEEWAREYRYNCGRKPQYIAFSGWDTNGELVFEGHTVDADFPNRTPTTYATQAHLEFKAALEAVLARDRAAGR